jgi:hypothetical protein
VAGGRSVREDNIAIPETLAAHVENDGMVDGIENPVEEVSNPEKLVLLADGVELRISIKKTR